VAAGFPAIAQSRPLRIGALISQADARGQDEMIQPYDQQMKLGLELAISEINGSGGILNRQVELLIADDDGSPAPGANAALSMIKGQGVEASFNCHFLDFSEWQASQLPDNSRTITPSVPSSSPWIKFSSGYASLPMYVARAGGGRLEVVRKFDAAPSGVTCA
jgi:ABC-type branched-subunit amino acid transport system substrate-binding protein